MSKKVNLVCGLVCVALLGISGCGRSGYTKVTGTVTLDEAPLVDANVIFRAPGMPMATARTDETGRFLVETGGARGMMAGEYVVTVAAFARAKKEGGLKAPVLVIPKRYNLPNESGLTAVIEGGTTDLTFALTAHES